MGGQRAAHFECLRLSEPTFVEDLVLVQRYIWQLISGLAQVLLHLTGVCVVAVTGLVLFMDRAHLELLGNAVEHGGLVSFASEGLVHIALAALVWAALCAVIWWVRRLPEQNTRAHSRHWARGSVYVETLIVLPVALLMFFGLAQMAINNMAGVFTNLATFQATRAAWLWQAEESRLNLSQDEIDMRVRIQAAAVLTPVAPGTFFSTFNDIAGADPEAARNMRGLLVGSQLGNVGGNVGLRGKQRASNIASSVTEHSSGLVTGLDADGFIERSVRKFSMAYHATEVDIASSPQDVTVRLTYYHQCVLPLVCNIFGERRRIGQNSSGGGGLSFEGYYTTIEREWTRKAQVPASDKWPDASEWSPVFMGI